MKGAVEVYETFIGEKTVKKEQRTEKSLIAVAVEVRGQKTGRVKLAKTPDASSISLKKFTKNIIKGSITIITDESKLK